MSRAGLALAGGLALLAGGRGARAPAPEPAQAPESAPASEPGRASESESELTRLRARVAELERARELDRLEIERLRAELAREARERLEREEEWLRFQRTLRELRPGEVQGPPPAAESAASEPSPTLLRDQEIARALHSLLVLEEVRGLDLLETGALHGDATGPVVLRVLDSRGRPLGTLAAERLRLEGSRAARTLTLVLEDGHESRGGESSPFPEGPDGRRERRILLPDVDPAHWAESLRELFGAHPPDLPVDDGKTDLVALRLELNELLRADAAAGYWRVRSLGGVQGAVLREVQLEELDREGRLSRRLFADRLSVHALERGLVLVLEDGAQVRGDEKTAFLDGRFRIFLPRAQRERWRAAGVPGLAPEKAAESRDGSPAAR